MDPPNDWVVSGGKGALDFDGSNDYTNVSNNPNLSLSQNSPITISAWVYTRSNAGYRTILTKRGATTNYELSFMNGDGRLIFYSGGALSLSTSQVSLNTWTHCAAVITGSTGGTYYIAGVNAGSATQAVGTPNNTALNIGAVSGAGQYINAQLDDIRIYNRALTEQEIRLLASERGIGLKPERQRNRYSAPALPSRNRSSRFLGFPA